MIFALMVFEFSSGLFSESFYGFLSNPSFGFEGVGGSLSYQGVGGVNFLNCALAVSLCKVLPVVPINIGMTYFNASVGSQSPYGEYSFTINTVFSTPFMKAGVNVRAVGWHLTTTEKASDSIGTVDLGISYRTSTFKLGVSCLNIMNFSLSRCVFLKLLPSINLNVACRPVILRMGIYEMRYGYIGGGLFQDFNIKNLKLDVKLAASFATFGDIQVDTFFSILWKRLQIGFSMGYAVNYNLLKPLEIGLRYNF